MWDAQSYVQSRKQPSVLGTAHGAYRLTDASAGFWLRRVTTLPLLSHHLSPTVPVVPPAKATRLLEAVVYAVMDPLTAIGLASNILSFIDFGFEVVSIAKDIHGSPTGKSEDGRNIEAVVKQMRAFSALLQPPDDAQLAGGDKALCALATECSGVSDEILRLLEKIRPKDPKSKSSSLAAAFKTKWYEGELRKLGERLDHSRAQLTLQLDYLTR